jgi:hypothetical protein
LLNIIAGTPGTCLVEHGIYVRPASDMAAAAYGSDRVVVMGDAAHPLRPTGGLALTHAGSYIHKAAHVGRHQQDARRCSICLLRPGVFVWCHVLEDVQASCSCWLSLTAALLLHATQHPHTLYCGACRRASSLLILVSPAVLQARV